MLLELKTNHSMFQLNQTEQELYKKHQLKLETKKTSMEHMKKLGFIAE